MLKLEHFYYDIGEDWFNYQDIYSQMVSYFPDNAHFVEVGSWKGRSSAYMAVEIINSQKHIKFDCVDTWEGSEEHINPESFAVNSEIPEDKNWLYKQFLINTSPVNHVINPIRTTSLEASKLYPNRSLDFVFIDAAHDYENVKADIEAWYPKVKIGGYIGGHDYDSFWWGVQKAVNEFLQQDFIKKENFSVSNVTWLYKK
jgi:cephalosporin hydroxylase